MIDIPAARFDDTRMTMLTAPAPLRSPTRRGAMALLLATLAPLAAAQGRYPDKPVKLIVPFPAGGAIDAIARPVAESMGKQLGQQFLVDNRAGAAGNIGTAAAAKSAADGYTLLVGTSATHGANQALFKKLPYDPLGDFEPILLLGTAPNVLVVNAEQGPTHRQGGDVAGSGVAGASARRLGAVSATSICAGHQNACDGTVLTPSSAMQEDVRLE